MNGAEFKQALSKKQQVYGVMFTQGRVGKGNEKVVGMGLDFVIVDNEHSPYSRSETADWIAMLKSLDIVPIVRVPVPKSEYITMAMDAGTHGILAPYVESVEQVQECVAACKYLPLKGEAVERLVATGKFPSKKTQAYLEKRNQNNFLVIGIESVAALENLEALVSVPGVDAAFVGPNDLSIQLGVPDDFQNPKYLEAVERIYQICTAHNVPLVIHMFHREMAEPWIKKGVHFILYRTDRTPLEDLQVEFEFLRSIKTKAGKSTKKPARKNNPLI